MRRHRSFGTVVIGKNVLIREGIARILRAENFRILASVSYPDELASTVRAEQLLFLIIHNIADEFNLVLTQMALVRERFPEGRIAIIGDHYGSTEPQLALQAGARGYFVSAISCDAFVKSIELVMMGETVFPPTLLSSILPVRSDHRPKIALPPKEDERASPEPADDATIPKLSPREMAILRHLIEGHSNKLIARNIDIAEATVKVHVKAILRKIRVQNRTQAAIWGMNNALPLPPANSNALSLLIDTEERERRTGTDSEN